MMTWNQNQKPETRDHIDNDTREHTSIPFIPLNSIVMILIPLAAHHMMIINYP